VPPEVLAGLRADPRVRLLGQDEETPPLLAAMDVVALPSYREGFGLVVAEAGAMGLPVVASRVTGIVDAVVDGETGALVAAGDPAALGAALARYLADPALRERHGAAGRARALRDLEPAALEAALVERYGRWVASARVC
jgi:glycosyltransferase involved in cell wall biosynthesis